jgi:hypothetical protein
MVVCWLFVEMQIGSRREEPGTWKEGYCSAKERIRQQASSDGIAAKAETLGCRDVLSSL